MKKGREEKTKFSKILPNNQIITACRIELQVQEMTMNEKLTMIGLIGHTQIVLILANWLMEKMIMICCFISRSLSSGIHLQKCYILKPKLLHLWGYEKYCYFLKFKLQHLWEYLKNCCLFSESATFPAKSTNLLLLV